MNNSFQMNVLLINPSTRNISYGKYAKLGGRNAPLSLCYLAGALRQNIKDLQTRIIDADILDLGDKEIMESINAFKPDLIGITCVTSTFYLAKRLAGLIKEQYTQMKIVIGGPHASALPLETIANECLDYLVFGEGEYTFVELVQGKPLSEIKGLAYKVNGKIVVNQPRDLVENLDDLPLPAIDLLPDVKSYHPQVVSYRRRPCFSMITTRGCPYFCQFCDHSVFSRKYRAHSPERVFAEIKNLIEKYGVREIKFLDDNFCLDNKRVEKICALLIQAKFDLIWVCSARADMDLNLLKKMKEAGCWQVCVGIESGNQKILDFIHKDINLEMVRGFVEKAHKIGIKVRGFFMMGHAIETKETIDQTIDFALSLPLYTAEFSIATPFPHTELNEIVEKYGTVSSDLSDYSTLAPAFVPRGLTAEYLVKKQKQGHQKFYFRFKKIWEFLINIRSLEDIKKYWQAFRALN